MPGILAEFLTYHWFGHLLIVLYDGRVAAVVIECRPPWTEVTNLDKRKVHRPGLPPIVSWSPAFVELATGDVDRMPRDGHPLQGPL